MDVRASRRTTSRRRDHRRASAQGVSLNVRTTPEADHHVRAIDEWWRKHRTAAPNLFSRSRKPRSRSSARRPTSDIRIEDRPSEARDGFSWYVVVITSTTCRSTTRWSLWRFGTPAAEVAHHFDSSNRGGPAFQALDRTRQPVRRQTGVKRYMDATNALPLRRSILSGTCLRST